MEDTVLESLVRLAMAVLRPASRDPQCACCERGLFIGGHVCPPAVIEARRARGLIADAREVR